MSPDNPGGDLSITDLKLAAIVTALGTHLHHRPDDRHLHTCFATDNASTQAWIAAGSPTSTGLPAFLLHHLAHKCQEHNVSLQVLHTPGATYTIADFLTRSFVLSDVHILRELHIRVPTQQPPLAALTSQMNWALSKLLQPPALQPPAKAPPTPHGPSGPTSVPILPVTLSSRTLTNLYRCNKNSLTDIGWAQWLPPVLQSSLEWWNWPYVPWARRSPHWAIAIPDCSPRGSWTSTSIVSSKPTPRSTHHPCASSPFLYKSSSTSSFNPTALLKVASTLLDKWSPWVSSSFCAPGNMRTQTTLTPPLSDSKMSTCFGIAPVSTFSRALNRTLTLPPMSPWNLQTKKTELGAN
jgi:hypothetical protein